MEVEVSRKNTWKLTRAANHHLHETVDAGAYPFSWRLQVLMNAWDAFNKTEGTTWTKKARELETSESGVGIKVAEIEGKRQLTVDDELAKRVNEVVTAERPDVLAKESSFDENLQVVLKAWNEYYQKKGVGWQQ